MGPSEKNPYSGLFVQNQYDAMNKEAIKTDFFYLNQDIKTGLAKIFRYPLFFYNFFIKYVLSTKKIDIIHVHFYFPLILFAISYKLLRNWQLKIVVTFHGSDVYLYSPPGLLYRLSSYLVDKYIFVSQSLQNKFYRNVDAEIISAGVSDFFFHHSAITTEKKYDLIFVGHLDFNKGLDRLIHLVNSLERSDNKLNIAVVGKGNNHLVLNESKHNICYLGAKSPKELVVLYHQSKYLINLSRNESFGLVMAEAMACGTPVIATRTDGSSTQVIDKVNGFLWRNEDHWLEQNAGKHLQKVLSLPQSDYQALSTSSKSKVEPYKLSQIAQQLSNVYFNVISDLKKN